MDLVGTIEERVQYRLLDTAYAVHEEANEYLYGKFK